MQIHGLGQLHGPQQLKAPHTPHAPAGEAPAPGARGDNVNIDQLDISPEADLLSRARDAAEIRQDRVDAIRQQIADGTYDTHEKLDVAVSRLLDEIA